MADDCVRRSFADLLAVEQVDAAHPRLGRERNKTRTGRNRHIGTAAMHLLPGSTRTAELVEQFHDALALGRLIGGRGLGRQAGDIGGRKAVERHELRCPAVADGDGSGLVQEQRIHVAGNFHRLAALGHDVGPQGAVHAGDADGRQKGADGRGDQTHQQGHQGRHVGAEAQEPLAGAGIVFHVQLDIVGERPECGRHDQEDQRESRQHDGKGDLVGRPLADGPFHQGNHAVEEGTARRGRNLDDDAVRKDARSARDAGAVPASLADHGSRLAGDRRLVDGGHAIEDFAVAGNHLAGDHFHVVSRAERGGNRLLDRPVRTETTGRRGPPRLPQGVGLGLAAGLGDSRGEVREQQCRHQPEIQGQQIAEPCRALVAQEVGDRIDDRQHRSHFDHEHHRVLPLDVGAEHDERLPEGGLDQLGVEDARFATVPPRQFEFVQRRACAVGSCMSVLDIFSFLFSGSCSVMISSCVFMA